MTADDPDGADATLRVDKWLWQARFLKSRSIATRLVAETGLRINGTRVSKPSAAVRAGDVLTFPLGPHVRVIRIVALGARRGPAPEARTLYEDLAPPEPRPRRAKEPVAAVRDPGSGRPTKRDRRLTDSLRGHDPSD